MVRMHRCDAEKAFLTSPLTFTNTKSRYLRKCRNGDVFVPSKEGRAQTGLCP